MELNYPLYKYASMMQTYSSLVISGAMFVTQMLSMLGIAASTNLMVWGLGGMISSLVGFIWGFMTFMNHWNSWKLIKNEIEDDDTYAALDEDVTDALALISSIETDWLKKSAMGSSMALTVWAYGDAWKVAQWWALPEEERMEIWESKKEEGKHGKGGKDKMMLNRFFQI